MCVTTRESRCLEKSEGSWRCSVSIGSPESVLCELLALHWQLVSKSPSVGVELAINLSDDARLSSSFLTLMSKIPPKRVLAPKESSLFKELLTLYETRQLKKGLKTADQILKKYPEHGGMSSRLNAPFPIGSFVTRNAMYEGPCTYAHGPPGRRHRSRQERCPA